jgi:predicted transcriptional regulator
MTGNQRAVLQFVTSTGPANAPFIACELDMDLSAVRVALSRLTGAGLIAVDGRMYRATDAGYAALGA